MLPPGDELFAYAYNRGWFKANQADYGETLKAVYFEALGWDVNRYKLNYDLNDLKRLYEELSGSNIVEYIRTPPFDLLITENGFYLRAENDMFLGVTKRVELNLGK